MLCRWLLGYYHSSGKNRRPGRRRFLSTALLPLLLLLALKSSRGVADPPTLTFVTTFSIYPASPFMLSTPSSKTPVSGASYLKYLSNNSEMMQPNQYGRSKGLLLYFTRELGARVGASEKFKHIPDNSGDPGASWTALTETNRTKALPNLILSWSTREVESGARGSWCVVASRGVDALNWLNDGLCGTTVKVHQGRGGCRTPLLLCVSKECLALLCRVVLALGCRGATAGDLILYYLTAEHGPWHN
jgi:hypothetical protein